VTAGLTLTERTDHVGQSGQRLVNVDGLLETILVLPRARRGESLGTSEVDWE
jgi:hypothetical protein